MERRGLAWLEVLSRSLIGGMRRTMKTSARAAGPRAAI
jgi:hypothetical protein